MDDQIKKSLKKAVEQAETGLAKSILRWKYKKEGRQTPPDHQLEEESRQVGRRAHGIIAQRGKSALRELKKAYQKREAKKEDPDE
ncbi:MAG: hypothetical protein GY849_04900 [Deltaproteobacteria bacterium]|nr:hypothetical protein [Deltaproteobacteria bacterium]